MIYKYTYRGEGTGYALKDVYAGGPGVFKWQTEYTGSQMGKRTRENHAVKSNVRYRRNRRA
jgi:hypothetical protein